ncbi:MAG: NAD(P)-dependent alcohol dehydrogenase [Acidobacteriota bacterium]
MTRELTSSPTLEPLELEAPRAGEVLVEVVACGVCHTDLLAPQLGPLPQVAGHEGSGRVLEVGAGVTKFQPGDAVALTFGSCGACPTCTRHEPAYCHEAHHLQFGFERAGGGNALRAEDGSVVHGSFFQQSAFATHVLATERNAVRLPAGMPVDLAAPLGCGVQTGYGAVTRTLAVPTGAGLVIFGAGSVGLSAVMAAANTGVDPIVAVDVVPKRLELAEELGATHVIRASDRVVGDVLAICRSGADFSLECAGQRQSFNAAIEVLAPLGTCGLVTVPDAGQPIPFEPLSLLTKGRKLVGVLEGSSVPDEFIPELCQLYLAGKLPYDRLVRRFPFSQVAEALRGVEDGSVVKPLLVM